MFKKAIDVQLSNIGVPARDEIEKIMVEIGLGQNSYFSHYVGEEIEEGVLEMPELDKVLLANGCVANEEIIVTCWW